MKTKKLISDIQFELIEKGFVHISYNSKTNIDEIINTLGIVIMQTEVRESNSGKSQLSSNKSMALHTDHKKANYILWFCHSQSAIGGETILLDTKPILNRFSEEELFDLSLVAVQSHEVFPEDKPICTLLTTNASEHIIYYAPWLAINSCLPRLQGALKKFEEAIKKEKKECLLLSEGDILIIDNNRMLHGRSSFPKNSCRWLTRYWIKRNND
jgi:hypothetical protein